MSFFPSRPGSTSLRELFAMFPDRAKFLLEYHQAVMRGPSPLSVAERELIFAYGSGVNACTFCHATHKYTAARLGVDEELFAKLLDDVETAPVEPKLKPVLRYVKKLTLTPSRVTQADADAIFAAGWNEQAFFDVVTICTLHNYMNRMVDGCGVEADEASHRASGDRLSSVGYIGVAERIGR